ncbi:MAG TPA: Rieske 2Fe-2S domain-containing protein [Coleofasciculaceae cyanobacterium]
MLTEDRLETLESAPVAAGGNDPTRFDWKQAWYPVFYVDDLDRAKPARFTLLGQDLVIWWDRQAATWRAFVDQCPHRLVPLSEGRIAEDGLLECPYHGWAFKGDGSCDRIPQQVTGNTAQVSKRACAKALPTAVRQGLLFVFPGQPEVADQVPIPIIEAMEETPKDWVCVSTFRDLPYDALTLLENVLDSSHVPFTHHRSLGKRENAAPVELEILTSGKQGFTGLWQEGPRKGTLGQQTTQFIAPGLMWHDLTSKQFGRTLTVVYATPTRKGESRLFARFPFRFSSKLPAVLIKLTPLWYSHLNQHTILEDDQIFLHYQERTLEAKGGTVNYSRSCFLPTRADRFVSALRKWVADFVADPFPGDSFPPVLPTELLLDRYHSHTKQCSSCRKALRRMQQLKKGAAICGVLALASYPLLSLWVSSVVLAVLSTAISLLAGALWLWLGTIEGRFYQGQEIPPRNLPD